MQEKKGIAKLVSRLMQQEPITDYIHQQTVKIPEKSHQKLIALARVTSQTKSELASALLEAAIDDAIEAVPEDDLPGYNLTLRQAVKNEAEENYLAFLAQHRGNAQQDESSLSNQEHTNAKPRAELVRLAEQSTAKKRQLVYVPAINQDTFLFFFSKGNSGKSYSFREYPASGGVKVTYARDYDYTADQILEMAQYKSEAPTHPTDDAAFWRAEIEKLNHEYLR